MSKTSLQQQVTVHALPSKIWKVLTSQQYVRQYFYRDDIRCDWTEGSSISCEAASEDDLTGLGVVIESVPGMFLKFSFFEEGTSTDLLISYELSMASDGIELKMKSQGFNAGNAEFILRQQQAIIMLQKIKWLSEYS